MKTIFSNIDKLEKDVLWAILIWVACCVACIGYAYYG
jgi:hypothetical protein